MTLDDTPVGAYVRIRRLNSRPEISRRLRELGFCENALVRCINRGYGNIICEVYNTRVGLDSALARRIHVAPSGASDTQDAEASAGRAA